MPNLIHFYFEGDDYFNAIGEAILSAQKSVDVEIYNLASDSVGINLADLLVKKAKEGLRIRLIYDAMGSRDTSQDMIFDLSQGGIQIKKFNSVLAQGGHFSRRNHRKMVVVDGKTGFIGGFNFTAEYSRKYSGNTAWRDTGVRMTEPSLVYRLIFLFHQTWQGRLIRARDFIKSGRRHRLLTNTAGPFFILANYGWRQKSLIREEYLSAIARAKKRVWLTTPYFVPDRGIRSALRRAARRGVDVRILVPGICDVPIVQWAAESTYVALMKAKVDIYEYQERVLHAKCAIVDDNWFTVGTANLDHLSFFKNLEVNLFGKTAEETQILAEQFQKDLQSAKRMDPTEWSQRSWLARLREKCCFYFRVWL